MSPKMSVMFNFFGNTDFRNAPKRVQIIENEQSNSVFVVAWDAMGNLVGHRLAEYLGADVVHVPIAPGKLWLHLLSSSEPMCET